MNSKIAFIIGTVVGAGIGVAGTYSYFKDKYEKLAEEDFNSRRAFDQDKKDESEEPVTEKTADSRTVYNPSIAECAAILHCGGLAPVWTLSPAQIPILPSIPLAPFLPSWPLA